MILFSHPTGSTMSRQSLRAIYEAGMLYRFYTTLGFSVNSSIFHFPLPHSIRHELKRRAYAIPRKTIKSFPFEEICRLLSIRLGFNFATEYEKGPFCLDRICRKQDLHVAHHLRRHGIKSHARMIYGYEDSCFRSFETARERGIHCIYELPIAYWSYAYELIAEESERLPLWSSTLKADKLSAGKKERKSLEAHLADTIICPSQFVANTLPEDIRRKNVHTIIPYGSPSHIPIPDNAISPSHKPKHRNLRVLFAGSLSQRKGLGDVFEAMKLLNRNDVELVVFGPAMNPIRWYRQFFANFIYEPPRSNQEVLKLMQTCDVLVLPSIIEGRAIVQLEALACGLPLIVTANAGGEDLIVEGKTGFLIPIRSPEKIAEKINWFADNQALLPEIRDHCQQVAKNNTWQAFRENLTTELKRIKSNLN